MTRIRTLIVDDEGPARRKIRRLLETDPEIEVVGEAATGPEALAYIRSLRPGLVFLDIQMPGMNGLELAKAIAGEPNPVVVFITAFDQHALQAFEVQAVDYLLKPFDPDRFRQALARAKEQVKLRTNRDLSHNLQSLLAQLQPAPPAFPDRILIELDERAFFLVVEKIHWVEAAKNYVNLHTQTETHTLRSTLESFAIKLNPQKFVQVNRSSIVNLDRIRELQPWFHGEYRIILTNGTELMWTRRYIGRAAELLNRNRMKNEE